MSQGLSSRSLQELIDTIELASISHRHGVVLTMNPNNNGVRAIADQLKSRLSSQVYHILDLSLWDRTSKRLPHLFRLARNAVRDGETGRRVLVVGRLHILDGVDAHFQYYMRYIVKIGYPWEECHHRTAANLIERPDSTVSDYRTYHVAIN